MVTRVTPAEVKAVIPTELVDSLVQIWIDVANTVVNSAADCIGGDEALLTQIELMLSCHYVALVDPDSDPSNSSIKMEKTEGLTTSYATADLKNNINDTTYGQAANQLSNGCLIEVAKPNATVEFF